MSDGARAMSLRVAPQRPGRALGQAIPQRPHKVRNTHRRRGAQVPPHAAATGNVELSQLARCGSDAPVPTLGRTTDSKMPCMPLLEIALLEVSRAVSRPQVRRAHRLRRRSWPQRHTKLQRPMRSGLRVVSTQRSRYSTHKIVTQLIGRS